MRHHVHPWAALDSACPTATPSTTQSTTQPCPRRSLPPPAPERAGERSRPLPAVPGAEDAPPAGLLVALLGDAPPRWERRAEVGTALKRVAPPPAPLRRDIDGNMERSPAREARPPGAPVVLEAVALRAESADVSEGGDINEDGDRGDGGSGMREGGVRAAGARAAVPGDGD